MGSQSRTRLSDFHYYHRFFLNIWQKVYFVHRHFHIVIIESAIYLDVKGKKLKKKKTGCNLWGITGLLNISRPLAPPGSCPADLDAPNPAPRLQRSAQPPTGNLRLGIRESAISCVGRKAAREGCPAALEFFFPSVKVCCAFSRQTRPRHAHLQGPADSAEVISQHPAVRPK